MILYSQWHSLVSGHSTHPCWHPQDSLVLFWTHISSPHSWQDCKAACSSPEPILFTPLGVGGREAQKCQIAHLSCSWALGNLEELYHAHAALTCSPGPVFTFSAFVLAKGMGAKQQEASCLLRFHSGSKAQSSFAWISILLGQCKNLGGGMRSLILRSSLHHFFPNFIAYCINYVLRVIQGCAFWVSKSFLSNRAVPWISSYNAVVRSIEFGARLAGIESWLYRILF